MTNTAQTVRTIGVISVFVITLLFAAAYRACVFMVNRKRGSRAKVQE